MKFTSFKSTYYCMICALNFALILFLYAASPACAVSHKCFYFATDVLNFLSFCRFNKDIYPESWNFLKLLYKLWYFCNILKNKNSILRWKNAEDTFFALYHVKDKLLLWVPLNASNSRKPLHLKIWPEKVQNKKNTVDKKTTDEKKKTDEAFDGLVGRSVGRSVGKIKNGTWTEIRGGGRSFGGNWVFN